MSSLIISRRRLMGSSIVAGTIAHLNFARAQQSEPIKIGVLQTISGSVADIGQAHVLGARIATEQFNKSGGINGRRIELVVRDTKLNPNEAVAAMHELAGSGINLVVGELFSGLAFACLPLLEPLNIVNVSPSITSMPPTHELFNRHFFRCAANAHMLFGGQAVLMAEVAPSAVRWGSVFADQVGSHQAWDAFGLALTKAYPEHGKQQVQLIEPVLTKPGTTDFRNAVTQLISQNLDGIQLALNGGEAITFIQQAQPFGLFTKIKAVADTSLSVTAGPALKRNTPPNFWSLAIWMYDKYKDIPMAQEFYQEIVAQTKDPVVNPFSAAGHNAVASLVSGARKAKSTDTVAVIEALETTPYDSIFGPLQYRKEDHQLLVNPGYLHVLPEQADPGYRNAEFVTVPYSELVERPNPGLAFKEG